MNRRTETNLKKPILSAVEQLQDLLSAGTSLKQILVSYQLSEELLWLDLEWDWNMICYTQRLSEPFILEFQEKLDWHTISIYQSLSSNFLS